MNLKVDLRSNFNGTLKFELKKEQGLINKSISSMGMCIQQLNHNEIAIGYEDGSLRIYS
jgi:hypothetical protein